MPRPIDSPEITRASKFLLSRPQDWATTSGFETLQKIGDDLYRLELARDGSRSEEIIHLDLNNAADALHCYFPEYDE